MAALAYGIVPPVTRPLDSLTLDRALELARTGLARPGAPQELPARVVLVDVERQRATLIEDGKPAASWPVSTSAKGIGAAADSFRTPPGWHVIHRKIGESAAPGTVFSSREPTGAIWRGVTSDEPCGDDLILTRILTLDGAEPGVNRGLGCDSFGRYIYLHGTNQETLVGRATSHGCVRMTNADICDLFARVEEGDHVLILGHCEHAIPDPGATSRFHYVGLGGSGMSALGQFQVMTGGKASGSDRAFDKGERAELRAQLEALGIAICPQDGSGVDATCAAVVVSTAVEAEVPDYEAAVAQDIPIIHRSELLAHFVAARRTIAVTGTSGKSTVTAMAFEILRGAGRDASVITGGDLRLLQTQGLPGNAYAGASDLLVIEADESDGSLVRYQPAVGVILNLQRDHKEMIEVEAMFATLRARARETLVVGDDPNLDALAGGALRFGFGAGADIRGGDVALLPDGSRFRVGAVAFTLPVPGAHNVANALAAIAACRAVDVELGEMVAPLASFQGVARRFQSVGTARGIEVIDDFAHNADKVAATLKTARLRGKRIVAVFQPHGYGPTRFLRKDFVATFARELGPGDRLYMLEIHYAGGTAMRDLSSADIVAEIADKGIDAAFAPSRDWLVDRIAEVAKPGDIVIVMGARDPSLTALAQSILEAIGQVETA